MSVVRAQARRRWAVVAAGVAVLCALPVLASALPVSVPALTAAELRARILASAGEPYAGYAESNATFGLPPLSGLSSVTSLLDGVTKMRVWQAAPDRWRVDVLSDAGERDTYRLGSSEYLWSSGAQLLTQVFGAAAPGLRLPRPADLVPPALALRLLRAAGTAARFSVIPAVRVAGQSAAGLRVTPTDAASTIGRIDIWAQPGTGLPLMVEIFGHGARGPALLSQFFQVGRWRPDSRVLTPARGPGTGFTVTSASSLSGVLSRLESERLRGRLAGRARVPPPPGFGTIGLYGTGLATFAVLVVPGDTGSGLTDGARSAGGRPLRFAGGTGVLIGAPLLNAVIVQYYQAFDTVIITGTVSSKVLLQAAVDLTGSVQ